LKLISTHFSSINKNTIATIGTFDGIHIGHQKILKSLTEKAKEENLEAVVLTFFPHPRMVLQKESKIKLLNTIDERIEILRKSGIDHIVVEEFTKEFSRLTAYDFVKEILVDKLKINTIIIGYDHHFGKNRTANINDLKEYGKEFNFKVIEIPAQDINDVAVSSTKIRKAILKGDIITANKYLGYNFMLSGIVVSGYSLGKTINFPTANIKIEEKYKLIPKKGVYIVSSYFKDRLIYGMMNIGKKPTVNGKKKTIEVHFFNFDEDLYDQNIQINILKRLRNEEKFESVEALKNQLTEDKKTALSYIDSIK